MTREEAKNEFLELLIDNTEEDGRLPQTSCKNMIEDLINELYDNFEQDLTIAVSEKTCDGCIHEPKTNENYPEKCGVCSRFYADEFKEKTDV